LSDSESRYGNGHGTGEGKLAALSDSESRYGNGHGTGEGKLSFQLLAVSSSLFATSWKRWGGFGIGGGPRGRR